MFTGLEAVDWDALEHAYGRAHDLPRQIRALASTDAGTREAALDALYTHLWNDGTLYPATPHAVPFLLELIANDTAQDRGLLLLFLADIGRAASFGDDPWYVDALTALQAGVPILERRLVSDDQVERIAAIVALAWADDGAVIAGRLPGGDEAERIVTLYALAAGRGQPPVELLERHAATGPAPSRLAAALGLVRAGQPRALTSIDPGAYAVLAEVIGTVAPQALPQPVELLDPQAASVQTIRALAGVLERTSMHRTAVPLVEFLLPAVFPDGYEEPPSALQLEVLRAVASGKAAWVFPADTTAALAEHGLDVIDRTDLCVRIGVDPPERSEIDRRTEDTATLLAAGEETGVRYEELSRTERDLLERFVDTLDAFGWNDTRNWHKFVTSGSGYAISPIGVGRHFNERAVLECTLWLFDEHVAADTGERTGDPYVRLVVSDKAERKDPIGFRAYAPDNRTLQGVLQIVDRHRPSLDRDNFGERFLHELFDVTSKVEVELAEGRVLEIRPRTGRTPPAGPSGEPS
jgi:hypothetical protein